MARRRTTVRSLLALLVPALVLALAAPAVAQVTSAYDRKGDGVRILGQGSEGPSANGDIHWVRIDHRPRVLDLKIFPQKATDGDNHVAAIYDNWVDTRGAGYPEYVVSWNLETERVYVHRAHRFSFGRRVCNLPMERYNYRYAYMTVPRRCLGRPDRLRVSVQASDNDSTVRSDWAPRYHTYSLWARRG